MTNHAGELAALGAAAVWAVSAVLYRRAGTAVPPLALNLTKGAVTLPLLGLVLWAWPGDSGGVAFWPVALLALSGAIGIGVGDTAFFGALNRLGESRTVLMVETLAPPMAAAIAFVAIGETLPLPAVLGIAVTLAGVAWVIVERSGADSADPRQGRVGVACGLLGAACQAIGAVLSRAALTDSEIGPALASAIRIAGGVGVLLVWMPIVGQEYAPPALRKWKTWKGLAVAIFLGTFLGLCLQQQALKHAEAGVVQTLIATSALFVLPAIALRGERIGPRAVVGAGVAVVGVALLVMSR